MPWKIVGNCVHTKNEDGSTGAVVKCHATREKAEAHMRALYKNVPDAKAKPSPSPKQSYAEGRFVPFSRYEYADEKAEFAGGEAEY